MLRACASLMLLAGCASTPPDAPPVKLLYVGSSTVGALVRDTGAAYRAADLTLETAPESEGGERAILALETDLAGVAREPSPAVLTAGVEATLVGRDAIAVIVQADLGIQGLDRDALRRIFRGEVHDWAELGGPSVEIEPFVVAPDSATRSVLRAGLLGGDDVEGCEEVRPDLALVDRVAAAPGGIGAISFAFLGSAPGVRAIAVDGHEPTVTNFEYPLSRPLFLLWRRGDPAVEAFVDWVVSPAGQRLVMQRFVGIDVRGSARASVERRVTGTLVVLTETFEVQDGGILYYPHRPYELLTRHGELLQRVRNHRGINDENPTRLALDPGIYLVRTMTVQDGPVEYFARVDEGRVTELDIPARIREDGR